ncbi:unnamed protein product [Absidia cylindrospora]
MDSAFSSTCSGDISQNTEHATSSMNSTGQAPVSDANTATASTNTNPPYSTIKNCPPSSSSANNDILPQPHNSNHIGNAPLKEKLLTNSSYLAAEIPLKFGHFMNHLWMSGSEFLNDSTGMSSNSNKATTEIWLLGCRYDMPDHIGMQMQHDMLEAQKDNLFTTAQEQQPGIAETGISSSSSSSLSYQHDTEESPDRIKAATPSAPSPSQQENTGSATPSTHANTAAVMSLLWPSDFYSDFTSRFWMTYRHNYPPIRPSHYKTDIGWGCMLRSGQSLLANALMIHFLSRQWRRLDSSDSSWNTYTKIAHWFLDELSPRAPFSIHRIALLGKQLGKNIGEWFGPSTISQVIQALVSDFPEANMAVYVAMDGVVYRKDVHDVATGKKPRGDFGYLTTKTHVDSEREEARKIYNQSNSAGGDDNNGDISPSSVFKPTLILVTIRLGIDHLHPSYYPALKACFQLDYFVGIAGGRPNSSLYFMGLQDDELIYIDPHFSRPALETKNLVDYTEQDLATYHCTIPRKLPISQVDPSMMLGFYCRTQQDFDIFCEQITQIGQHYSAIFAIQEQAPEYDEDVRSEHDFGVISDEDDDNDGLDTAALSDDGSL